MNIGGSIIFGTIIDWFRNIDFNVGGKFKTIIDWLSAWFDWLFEIITDVVENILWLFEVILGTPHPLIIIAALIVIAFFTARYGVAIFTAIGFLLILSMGYWTETMDTLALIFTAVVVTLTIGLPLGVLTSKKDWIAQGIRPILDFMQTLPPFVYLIPAVIFFSVGKVPGVVATLIFALPPAVRLTNLGIRQVPVEIKEAAASFGSTPTQMLFKAELPSALPTIMAGVNQTIMLALSMVVVAGLIGAEGLGGLVVKAVQQNKVGLGFESGISIVILAIFLDRVTQALGTLSTEKGNKKGK